MDELRRPAQAVTRRQRRSRAGPRVAALGGVVRVPRSLLVGRARRRRPRQRRRRPAAGIRAGVRAGLGEPPSTAASR